MSSDPTSNDAQDESAPQPPTTSNPLTALVVPAIVVILVIALLFCSVIPVFSRMKNIRQKIREIRPRHAPAAPHREVRLIHEEPRNAKNV